MAKSTKTTGKATPVKRKTRTAKAKVPVDHGKLPDLAASITVLRAALADDLLDDNAIAGLMRHFGSVLAFRRVFAGGQNAEDIAGLCYKGVGGTNQVTIWNADAEIVGRCSRQEAQDLGIPACG